MSSTISTTIVAIDEVQKLASEVLHSHCRFILGTDRSPFVGGENLVFAIESCDGKIRIAFRTPRLRRKDEHASVILETLRTEVGHLEKIKCAGLELFQTLIYHDISYTNSLGSPFVITSWVDGQQLKWSDTVPVDRGARNKIIHAIANASIDLLKIQKHSCLTARIYVSGKIDRKINRATTDMCPDMSIAECEAQKDLMDNFMIAELDAAPFALVHGDISPSNVIVDPDGNVRCVIDLNWAEMVPLQFAAVYPRFLTHEPSMHGTSHDWTLKNTETMEIDRNYFLTYIRQLGEAGNSDAKIYHAILSRHDEIERYWWFSALSQRNVHKAMVSCDWKPPIKSFLA